MLYNSCWLEDYNESGFNADQNEQQGHGHPHQWNKYRRIFADQLWSCVGGISGFLWHLGCFNFHSNGSLSKGTEYLKQWTNLNLAMGFSNSSMSCSPPVVFQKSKVNFISSKV